MDILSTDLTCDTCNSLAVQKYFACLAMSCVVYTLSQPCSFIRHGCSCKCRCHYVIIGAILGLDHKCDTIMQIPIYPLSEQLSQVCHCARRTVELKFPQEIPGNLFLENRFCSTCVPGAQIRLILKPIIWNKNCAPICFETLAVTQKCITNIYDYWGWDSLM